MKLVKDVIFWKKAILLPTVTFFMLIGFKVSSAETGAALICKLGASKDKIIIDTAADELKLHLTRFFNMDVTVTDGIAAPPAKGLRFIIGSGPENPAPPNEKGKFNIVIRDNTIWLWGYDKLLLSSKRKWLCEWDTRNSQKGSLQAAYQFLYEFGGIRWLLPGDENTVCKKTDGALKLPSSYNKTYSFFFARVHLDVAFADRGSMGNHLLRNMGRLNVGSSDSFIHYWGPLIGYGKYFNEHPEYYSLVNGKRKNYTSKRTKGNQVCTSNPAVAEIFSQGIIDFYRREKKDVIQASPNDGQGFCECEQCRALDRNELYSATDVNDLGGRCFSDRIFAFMNAVARKVRNVEPDARIGVILYSYYAMPPKSIEHIESNIYGDFCVEPSYFNDRDYKQKTFERMQEWVKKGVGGLSFFLYQGSYGWGQTLHICPHAMADFIKEIATVPGVLGVKTESNHDFGPNGLNYYVYFALLNDPNRNVDDAIDEFCTLAYGPGAPEIKKFFKLAEDTFMARDSKAWTHYAEVVRWYDDAFFKNAYALIDQAAKAVEGNTDINYVKRINIMRGALDHTFNLCDFIKKAAALKAYGLVFDLPHLNKSYKSPIKVNPGDTVMRDRLIAETAESYRRMTNHCKKMDGGSFFFAGDMLRCDTVGQWEASVAKCELMLGKKEIIALSESYPFQIDPQRTGETEKWYAIDFGTEKWKKIRLDANWESQGFGTPEPDGYNGVAWYRISFRAPLRNKQMKVELYLGGVDESCRVWVNGKKAGEFIYNQELQPNGWNMPRILNITDLVNFSKVNQIAVQVEDKSGKGGIWKGAFIFFSDK